MVSVTGSLAMNNASSQQDDIDLLIVAARNRVWLTRGLVLLLARLARKLGAAQEADAEHRVRCDGVLP